MTHGDRVREFHEKHGFCVDALLHSRGGTSQGDAVIASQMIVQTAHMLAKRAALMETELKRADFDVRLLRAHLLCEELAETLQGLAERSELKTLDGLADLDYVLWGTAVTFGLPLEEAHIEVHRSNMTKAKKSAHDPRCRDKGDSYEPPNLVHVLRQHDARVR